MKTIRFTQKGETRLQNQKMMQPLEEYEAEYPVVEANVKASGRRSHVLMNGISALWM